MIPCLVDTLEPGKGKKHLVLLCLHAFQRALGRFSNVQPMFLDCCHANYKESVFRSFKLLFILGVLEILVDTECSQKMCMFLVIASYIT